VLDELGLQLQDQLPDLPKGKGPQSTNAKTREQTVSEASGVPGAKGGTDEFDELQRRLDNLRRDE